jgi:hypothetical protein
MPEEIQMHCSRQKMARWALRRCRGSGEESREKSLWLTGDERAGNCAAEAQSTLSEETKPRSDSQLGHERLG